MNVFGEYARFYDALYSDKDYVNEAKEVDCLLKKHGGPTDIIVFGCGTGKHDKFMKELGYTIHGLDMSEEMVAEAKKNNDGISYEVADIRSYSTTHEYDAVISLFHVMSYQNSNEDIKNAFRSARKALKKGGIFLFDLWYGPGVLTDPPVLRVKEADDPEYHILRVATPKMYANKNIVDVNYKMIVINKETSETRIFDEKHSMRYFFAPEIEEYLSGEGFTLIECLDCRTMKEPDYSSWTSYFIAKAI